MAAARGALSWQQALLILAMALPAGFELAEARPISFSMSHSGETPVQRRMGEEHPGKLKTRRAMMVDGHSVDWVQFMPADAAMVPKPWPVIVFLHGGSVNILPGGRMANLRNHALVHYAGSVRPESFPFALVAPLSPKPRKEFTGRQPADVVAALVKEVLREYSDAFDSRRVYLTGLSLGGFGTFSVLSHHPELFAAAVPVSGGCWHSECNVLATRNLPGKPMWIFAGTNDKIVKQTVPLSDLMAWKTCAGTPACDSKQFLDTRASYEKGKGKPDAIEAGGGPQTWAIPGTAILYDRRAMPSKDPTRSLSFPMPGHVAWMESYYDLKHYPGGAGRAPPMYEWLLRHSLSNPSNITAPTV